MLIENSVSRVTVRHHSASRYSGNCSTSRGLPSDAEKLPEWRNFQFAPKNHYGFLHTLPSTIAFRLDYVLFYKFYAKYLHFSIKKRFVLKGNRLSYALTSKRLAETDVKMTSRCQNDIKTSKSTYWRHARESSYTPHVSSGRVHGNPGRVCKNIHFLP